MSQAARQWQQQILGSLCSKVVGRIRAMVLMVWQELTLPSSFKSDWLNEQHAETRKWYPDNHLNTLRMTAAIIRLTTVVRPLGEQI